MAHLLTFDEAENFCNRLMCLLVDISSVVAKNKIYITIIASFVSTLTFLFGQIL